MLLGRMTSATKLLAAVASMAFLQGCFVDTSATGRTQETWADGTVANRNSGLNCKFDSFSGCLEAAIPAAPEVTVNGKAFFDANDLSLQFEEVLGDAAPKEQVDQLQAGGKIELLTRIDNRAFHKGFQIYIKGEAARSADALASGGFMLHRLPEGAYNVRVQKLIRYRIIPASASAEVSQTELVPAADTQYCATLYAEATVEVRSGERLKYLFDDYELRVNKEGCAVF
jgi:hypothetical protein